MHRVSSSPFLWSERIVQICLFLLATIAFLGGSLQLFLGQPETTPRLDNIHRFLAGLYLGYALLSFWAAWTVQRHRTLIFIMCGIVVIAAFGRVLSIAQVGLPSPPALWIGYVVVEFLLPIVMASAHVCTLKARRM